MSGAAPAAAPGLTEDALLGGRVRLRQPADGYRAAIDPVLLAAAVPAGDHETVLDIGCGAGAASLCLAARVPLCRITGLEQQLALVRLAGDNAALNGVAGRFSAMVGDLLQPPPRLAPGSFAHVMANPPFLEAGAATPPPDAGKRAANVEGAADLAAWVRFAAAMARPKGSVTFVHRADRVEHLLAAMAGRLGEIVLFPLWPGEGKPAKRILVRGRKDIAGPSRIASGLVLHRRDGGFTEAADAVLRHAAALEL
jgi:tRNA1(Val) A37 N6-methylase TrmN6